jgi:allantoinase
VSVVVKNGNIVTPTGVFRASVFVSDGKITGLGEGVRDRGAEVIDADGMYVFPGFVDEHVHFREPGLEVKEDFETGSKSAVAGGVTTVLEMPNTIPPVSDVKELRLKDSIVRGKAFSDYGLYGVLTDYSLDELEELFDAGAVGFKAFLGPTTGDIAPPSDATVYKALEKSAAKGFPIAFHCENRQLVEHFEKLARERGEHPLVHLYSRPAVCEVESVRRVVYLAQKTGGRALIVHISSGETVSFLEREHLPNVFTETCPQYLFFDSRDYERLGTLIKVNPPIRGPDDREMLWEGIRRGVIKTLGSDHAPPHIGG